MPRRELRESLNRQGIKSVWPPHNVLSETVSRTSDLVPRSRVVLTDILEHAHGEYEQVPLVSIGLHLPYLEPQWRSAIASLRQGLDDNRRIGVLPACEGVDINAAVVVALCCDDSEEQPSEDDTHGVGEDVKMRMAQVWECLS